MLLTCPNCGTQYVVKDDAIPPQGRQVRCASCKHSWHQDPEQVEAVDEAPVAQDAAPMEQSEAPSEPEDETLAEATLIEPRSGPEAEQRAYEAAVVADATSAEAQAAAEPSPPEYESAPEPSPTEYQSAPEAEPEPMQPVPFAQEPPDETPAAAAETAPDWREPPQPEAQDDEFSPFAARDDELEPRRRSPLLILLMVALLVAALAAAFWFLAPAEWKARVGLADSGTSPLALVTTHMDRQRLESGNELLTVTGRVINPTAKDQAVPPLQAQLKSRTGQIVYSWTIAPPARTLPPGASASFNSAEVNVPPGGDELTITLGQPKA